MCTIVLHVYIFFICTRYSVLRPQDWNKLLLLLTVHPYAGQAYSVRGWTRRKKGWRHIRRRINFTWRAAVRRQQAGETSLRQARTYRKRWQCGGSLTRRSTWSKWTLGLPTARTSANGPSAARIYVIVDRYWCMLLLHTQTSRSAHPSRQRLL